MLNYLYSGVRVIASRILHEICLLIGELAIRRTNLTLIARLGDKSDLLIEQYILLIEQLQIGEPYCNFKFLPCFKCSSGTAVPYSRKDIPS